jgi:hypothetical protein
MHTDRYLKTEYGIYTESLLKAFSHFVSRRDHRAGKNRRAHGDFFKKLCELRGLFFLCELCGNPPGKKYHIKSKEIRYYAENMP